ncbi:DnaJ domain protein [Yasminevirus sp. GU-2018]|uniref:DnaJ domain protein n=1 Tax=Yasminevirus sp. GU-2018 TaxID=2420051 RepID=A0A5K0U956_9VIRU|nr:DnaJ domain protein [Yasminevirus sp. GU-2018]
MSKRNDKKSEQVDYYTLLELDRKCTKAEIDSAYRRLAVRWHPDKNKDNKELAEKKFREISSAYQVLSDETARKNYDKHGVTSKGAENIFDPYEMFKGMFDTEDNQIPDVVVTIQADIHRLYKGFTETVKFSRFDPCSKCDATGTKDGREANCDCCKGRGILMETSKGGKMGYVINERQCDHCEGNGIDPEAKLCKKCSGSKYVQNEIECEVDVPPGAYDNYYIKLEDEGNFIPKDERKGKHERTSVIVVIKEKNTPDCKFRRGMFIQEINRVNLADVLLTVDVNFGESIVGIKKEIEFLADETVGVDIDSVIQNGDIHVVKNKGMPLVPEELEKMRAQNKNAQTRGDLFLHFKVERPTLNKQKRNRLWQIITDTPYPETDDVNDVVNTVTLNEYITETKKTIAKSKATTVDSDDVSQDDSQDANSSDDSKIDQDDNEDDQESDDASSKSSRSNRSNDSNKDKKAKSSSKRTK